MSLRVRLCLVLICLVALGFRLVFMAPKDFLLGYHANEDALAHMVVTSNLIADGNAERGLPVFTFPDSQNRWINNLPGAGLFSADGRFYYTSFPPGTFLPLAGLGWLSGWSWTPFSARCLLILLHLLTAGMIAGLVREFCKPFGARGACLSSLPWLAFVLALTTFEFARSYTFSFWGQHWLQILLILQVWIFFRRNRGVLFHLLVFVMPLIEWTGYVANAGLVLVMLLEHRFGAKTSPGLPFARGLMSVAWVVLLTCSAAFVHFAAFGGVVGYGEYLAALAGRKEMRGTDWLSLIKLPFAAGVSAGPLLMIPLWLSCRYWGEIKLIPGAVKELWLAQPQSLLALLLLLLPCMENLLLSKHALAYTFDRVKVCGFLIVFICLLPVFANAGRDTMKRFEGLVACVCFLNLLLFLHYAGKIHRDREQDGGDSLRAAKYVAAEIPASETVIVHGNVRASFLYYAGRNVAEELEPVGNPAEYLRKLPNDELPAHLVVPGTRKAFHLHGPHRAIETSSL